MKSSYCKVCGVELTPENAYSRIRETFLPVAYCKGCDNKKRTENYKPNKRKARHDGNKKFTLKVRRGRISFASYLEKHSFATGRRLQARFGRGHISPSSNYGKAVFVKTQEEKEVNGEIIIIKRYVPLKCDKPDCKGVIRSKDNGFQICENCGLVANDRFAIYHIDDSPSYGKLTWSKRLENIPIPETESRGDSAENARCFDRYYAQAYSKRLQ